jgi:dienelactone hydrolase
MHGIINAKETVSGFALELARRGFVSLSIDAVGHGNSGGQLEEDDDLTLGFSSAIEWIEKQPYVNSSALGLIGFSMGAGAARATVEKNTNIGATVLIGGGISNIAESDEFIALNSTLPKNLLIAVGQQDPLFNIEKLKSDTLKPIFNTSSNIVPNVLYGSYDDFTARKLITPKASHLTEAIDNTITSSIIEWMTHSLKGENSGINPPVHNTIYLFRDLLIFVSLICFVALIFPLSIIFKNFLESKGFREDKLNFHVSTSNLPYGLLEDWKVLLIWGILGLGLFLPMLILGSFIPFPPLVFGGSIAWWLSSIGVISYIFIYFYGSNISNLNLNNTKELIINQWDRVDFILAISLSLVLYSIIIIIEYFLTLNLKIYVPIFNEMPLSRLILFFVFLPFTLVYFFVEGLFFHVFHYWIKDLESNGNELKAFLRVLILKITPFIIVLILFYIPLFFFNVLIVPAQAGFFLEFLVVIVPLFIITSAISWWLYRHSGRLGTGTLVNAILISWISASLFPIIKIL